MIVARVKLWGKTIGAVSWDETAMRGNFEYDPAFTGSGIEVAPFTMPLADTIYTFPALPADTFHGLPGMLADSLPDDFGNALIDAWLLKEGQEPSGFNPVERLRYTGSRGMGALEYSPATGPAARKAKLVDVGALVELAGEIITQRNQLKGSFASRERENTLNEILRIGTSAGGARAKAIIAWNRETNEVRSGQVKSGSDFSYWILKFDGVSGNKDKELEDPAGYGLIEFAYHEMATAAGIEMTQCRLLRENGRSHFMAKRFDRSDSGQKLHMQSFGALEHFDFRKAGAYSYEQVFQTIRKLGLPMAVIEEQFRRMAFNIIARNQDDHVKNIAFLMNKSGQWSLSPAFDITYSYNPDGVWTSTHQMSMNSKRDRFGRNDFRACARLISMQRGRADEILEQIQLAVQQWPQYANNAGVDAALSARIEKTHRINILS